MEKIAKGLHSINSRIPTIVLKRDFLSFGLQIASLFVCIISAALWPILGFDSTLDQLMSNLVGKHFVQAGAGTHLSTILTFFLVVFFISVYLSEKEIVGFHNVIVSVFVPIAGMMVFEFPWVALSDLAHQLPVEKYMAITLFGLGRIDPGMLIIGLFLIPTSIFYFSFMYTKGRFAQKWWISVPLMVSGVVATTMLIFSLAYGTLTILIRNTFALFFLAFAHATFEDATRNWNIKGLATKYETKRRIKAPVIFSIVATATFVAWVFWPYFAQIKGAYFPQTLYAFYADGIVSRVVWVPNNEIHALNVISKAFVSAATALAVIPVIKVRDENK